MFLRPGTVHAGHVDRASEAGNEIEFWAVLGLLALIVLGAFSGMLWAKAYGERHPVGDDDEEGL